MAGDWIKIEHATPDKPEVIAMADLLDIDQDAVFGKLVRLWIWADQQLLFGNALSVTEKFIDRKTRVTGFARAMQKVNWIALQESGLVFPNFSRHNGITAKKRGLSTKRMKRFRYANSVTKASPEKRREEKSNITPLPPSLDTPDFRAAWSDWLKHRKEIGKALKPTSQANKLKQFCEWGPKRAIAAIRHSIGNGWEGCFEPNENGRYTHHKDQEGELPILRAEP